jgi:hypothetical protein
MNGSEPLTVDRRSTTDAHRHDEKSPEIVLSGVKMAAQTEFLKTAFSGTFVSLQIFLNYSERQ